MTLEQKTAPYPQTAALVTATLQTWPEHEKFINRSFGGRTEPQMVATEFLADKIMTIVGADAAAYVGAYRFTCDKLNEEELFFRRNDTYRYATFAEVNELVYQNHQYMSSYVKGLLWSQALWSNHMSAFSYYKECVLEARHQAFDVLEIGPGHGLFLAAAIKTPLCKSISGWDISPASLEQTAHSLKTLGLNEPGRVELAIVDVLNRNISTARDKRFDVVVLSEILEHTEDPQSILKEVRRLLKPWGQVYINVPINCPAPDHIYLLTSKEDVETMITASGYSIDAFELFPMTGFDLSRAMHLKTTVSCVVIAS